MRRVVFVVVAALLVTSCASLDKLNKVAADSVSKAITASEQNRCTVHPAPCLSDDQFKAVNASLYRVSVAGRDYTRLRLVHADTRAVAAAYIAVIASEIATIAKRSDAGIGEVLAELTTLQTQIVDLLTGMK